MSYNEPDDYSDNEEEGKSWEDYGGRDAAIFLIEMSEEMLRKREDEGCSSYVQLALKCAVSMYMNKVWSSNSDYVGVVLFGTGGAGGVHLLQKLQLPGPQPIRQLEANADDVAALRAEVGLSGDYSLTEALTQCSAMFSQVIKQLGSRRVLLLTSRDSPPDANSDDKRRRLIQKVADERDISPRLQISLFPLGQHFDMSTFYKETLLDDDGELEAAAEASADLNELLQTVRQRSYRKRVLGKIPFHLGDGVKLAVGVYNLVRPTPMPSAVKLDKRDNAEVRSTTGYRHQGTGQIMLRHEVNHVMNYGGKDIAMNSDEVRSLRAICVPGLQLLGFQPIVQLDLLKHVQPSSFIYPEESWIKGSRALFAALLQRCAARQVAAVCRLVSRRSDTPHLVALLPQLEQRGDAGLQTQPPGFHVIFLPFADDVRQPPLPEPAGASDQQIAAARAIVTKLRFTYAPEKIESPRLQKHWRTVEAIALEREEPDEFVDYTAPDTERMARKAGALIDQFKSLVFPEGYAAGPAPTKRPRRDDGPVDMAARARDRKVDELKVPELKEFLRSVGGRTVGKKADLVAAVYAHYDQ